jgi:hypothetical protein
LALEQNFPGVLQVTKGEKRKSILGKKKSTNRDMGANHPMMKIIVVKF